MGEIMCYHNLNFDKNTRKDFQTLLIYLKALTSDVILIKVKSEGKILFS